MNLKTLFSFAVVFVVGILIGLVVASKGVRVPARLANVPVDASWQGGNDGGNWFRCVEQSLNLYRCQVYADVTGTLLIDDLFKPTEKGLNGMVNPRLLLSDYYRITKLNLPAPGLFALSSGASRFAALATSRQRLLAGPSTQEK
jgi:hypothetical protein